MGSTATPKNQRGGGMMGGIQAKHLAGGAGECRRTPGRIVRTYGFSEKKIRGARARGAGGFGWNLCVHYFTI